MYQTALIATIYMQDQSAINLELISKAQDGDNDAKTALLEQNAPLVKSVIRRYKNKGIEYDDLYQLGCMGFLKAIKRFSTKFEVKFSTYAVPMIAGEVKRHLRDDGYIKVSRSTKSLAAKISYFADEYKSEHGVSPSLDVISMQFGIDKREAVFAMDSSKYPVSIFEKSEDDSGQSLLDKLADPNNSGEEQLDRIILKDLIEGLETREKKIIILRYFRDMTQSEIARLLNISQVQVSRIESRIVDRMRKAFERE